MKTSILVTALALTAVGCTLDAQQPALEWGQWRGPQRDGSGPFTAPATWPQSLRKRWEVPVGAGHASPVIAGGRVIVHTRQGEREVTRALDLQNGTELWRSDYPAPYTMNPAARGHGPGPKSTPAVAGSRVFTFGISGILSAHDVATGKLLWRTDAPAAPPEFGTAMSPLVDGSLVIVHLGANDSGALTAFDVASGKPRWRWTGDGPGYASPVIAPIGGVRQLITQSENAVVGIDAASGQLLWRIPFRTSFDQNAVTPVVVNDLLIYSGLDNGTTAVRVVRKGTSWSTDPIWKNDQVSMYMSSPVMVRNTLYGLSHRNRGQFFAVDVTSGRTLWTTPGRAGENASILAIPSGLLLSTTDGELIVAEANPGRFAGIRRYQAAESAVWAHPALAGTAILIKDVDKLICWSLS
jgi:outer membrane protein assembly factor BamB